MLQIVPMSMVQPCRANVVAVKDHLILETESNGHAKQMLTVAARPKVFVVAPW